MKNKRIITTLLFVSVFSFGGVVSCHKNNPLADTDFDGLEDNIDPDPNNNQYRISLVTGNEEDGSREESNELTITVDYRDFLIKGYNHNLSLLASFFLNDVDSAYKPQVKNNVYPATATQESEPSPILAQIGCHDIKRICFKDKYQDIDPYDFVDVTVGYHTFTYENQKYQIYFAATTSYTDGLGWISNFDLGGADGDGALTQDYEDLEGKNHPDWTNHIHHKGFDATANRLLREIKDYQKQHNDASAKQITFLVGHSRGAAVSNLVAKSFVDDNQEIRAYCFNPPGSTLAKEEVAKSDAYQLSIFNFINNDDLVSRIPPKDCGFKLYGFDIPQAINANLYKNFMKKDYQPNTTNGNNAVVKFFNNLLTRNNESSRNNFYTLREKNDEYPEKLEGMSEQLVKQKLALLLDLFPENSYTRKCFTYGEPQSEEDIYVIYYQTKPALIKAVMVDFMAKKDFETIGGYLKLLSRMISEALDIYFDLEEDDFSIAGVLCAHVQPITCVMAEQYHG